ncbi:hypothetical protein SVIOM342S_02570 [Streptomyces violaceorubidus]
MGIPSVRGAAVVLGLIAVILLATALSIRARLKAQRERVPGAKGVDPMMAARAVVFGQASALVAALVSGMYGGTGVFSWSTSTSRPARPVHLRGCLGRGGYRRDSGRPFLERVCKLPEDEDDDHPGTATAA